MKSGKISATRIFKSSNNQTVVNILKKNIETTYDSVIKTDKNPDSAILLQTSKVKSIAKNYNNMKNNTGSDSAMLLQTSKVKSITKSDNQANNNTGSDSVILLQTSKVKSTAMNFNKITNNNAKIANSLNAKIDTNPDSAIPLQTSDNETNNNTGSNSTIILKTSKVKSIARNGNKVTTNNKNANTFITKTKISNTLKTSLIMLC